MLTNNLHCTFCRHCGLTVNALCMFLGSCVIALALVYCAICSVTNGLIRTWKIYKQFNRSNWFTERFSSRQGWANGNQKDGGVQPHLWCVGVRAFPHTPALLLIDGGSVFVCMSLECQMVVLIGSDLVLFNVDVTHVTTFPLSSNWRGSLSHVSPVASP